MPSNQSPSFSFQGTAFIDENAPAGTLLGHFVPHDPEGDAVSVSLVHDAGGRFAIVDGQLIVADGSAIDYETAPYHDLLVRVTDEHGAYREESVRIYVNDLANDEQSPPGADVLTGGLGRDVFLFDTKPRKAHADRITDFSVKHDEIHLARAAFKKAGRKGELDADAFRIGKAAEDADDRIVYDARSGKLYYDADGSGDKGAVLVARLKKGLWGLSEDNFFIV
jgi:hypothetical protein